MSYLVSTFLLVFAAMLPIVNPAGSALIFYDLTKHLSPQARGALARLIAIYSFVILNGSLYVGAYLLAFFGISIPVLRVAGGLIVAAAGWRFLMTQETDDTAEASEATASAPSGQYLALAFYPLTLPLTTGPGTISVMIALGTDQPANESIEQRVAFALAALAATSVMALVIWAAYAFAGRIQRVLGNTGTMVALRLSAFILFCIGIQILWNGAAELIRSVE